ncbi:probable acyl-CoA dehydrogenase 6 [Bradysia coprophila]|uniref:probable acyl-CoA dehydrogenase 6 n=1 Tax=Bradysia coprophila TaxID=38358 RepID=UPI00187DA30D|nr:probable acyl-CoA dehydrogenase 6 [Bradysia coprophila]
MFTKSVKIGTVANGFVKSVRGFSTSRYVTTAHYSSALPERFYNEEQLQMQQSLKKLIDTEINPYVNEWEAKEQMPSHHIWKLMGDAGFLGVHKPVEYGGMGLSYKYHAAVLEELGSIKAYGVSSAISVHTDVIVPPVAMYGSERLKKEFLVPSITGEYVGCVGSSEPGAGSDVANIKTKAVRQGDDLIINGQKIWITNGLKADWILLLANTSDGPPHKNKSLICVPLNVPGVTRVKIEKIGLKCTDWAQLFFEDVRVPASNILGKEGDGFKQIMVQFQDERLSFPLYLIRAMDDLISETVQFTQQRKTFGKSVFDNQAIQFRLSELATDIEALRALTYMAVDMHSEGKDVTRLASMAKLKCGRLAREVADSLLQLWGGMGFSSETQVSRAYRDFRACSIAGGTDEIILQILGRILFKTK